MLQRYRVRCTCDNTLSTLRVLIRKKHVLCLEVLTLSLSYRDKTSRLSMHVNIYVYSYLYVCTHIRVLYTHDVSSLSRLQVLSLSCRDKTSVTFRKRANNHKALLRKMTYKDKASCAFSSGCLAAVLSRQDIGHVSQKSQ